jgi:hypothetical protein
MKTDARVLDRVAFVVAAALGLLTTAADRAAPFGDDSAKSTILLWLLFSGLLGFARPKRPWRWAVSIGPWLPATALVLHALGQPGWVRPDTYATALILVVVSLAVCSLGAYGGAFTRLALFPPAPPHGGAVEG